MSCTCAPAIDAEMRDWIKLGGGNSGCCGNNAHTYGFHRAAAEIPANDYSRTHDAGRPVNMNWASAGDFAHNGNAKLRAVHAGILARLMNGELPMICEFIGQPWPDRPVYYWCRWAGVKTLKRYTGKGHDTWSHISWWRSRADQRSYMYATGGAVAPTPASPSAKVPTYPGHMLKVGSHEAAVGTFQARMRVRGWKISVDNDFGQGTLSVVKGFQKDKGLTQDGIVGPRTWSMAWTSPIT